MRNIIEKILLLDRRWVYLILAIALMVSIIVGKPVTSHIAEPVQNLYDAVQDAPAGAEQGKIILVGVTFSAGTLGENGNQFRALIRHLMLAKKRFAIVSVAEPQGARYGLAITAGIAKQYGYTYGTDWISFGYQLPSLAFYKTFIRDIPTAVKVDGLQQKEIASFPIMKTIHAASDIALLVEVTASSSVFDWIQYVQPATTPHMLIGYACTGVMGTEAYTYLDSKQLVGMMLGLKGAADYETLVDKLETHEIQIGALKQPFDYKIRGDVVLPEPARKLMFTQTTAHIVIILFICIGNLALLLTFLSRKFKHNVENS